MKVCFVALEATRLFDASSTKPFGGAEWRCAIFAKALAKHPDHDVEVVLGARDPRAPVQIDGLLARFDTHRDARKKHFPWLRWDRWRLGLVHEIPRAGVRRLLERPGRGPRVLPFYSRLDADVTCVFGVNDLTADVIRSRAAVGGKTVLLLAADVDLGDHVREGGVDTGPYGDRGSLGRYAVTNASAVVVQTEAQQARLREAFGIEGTLIRNPVDTTPLHRPPPPTRRGVLWVGRADRNHKRPEAGFAVARRCPDVPFLFVMNRHKKSLYDEIAASAPPNVEIVERLGPEAIGDAFGDAAAFLNTSIFEGFPNTFLQAAVHRLPYLALDVDPDDLFARRGLGYCARGDGDALAAELRRALSGGDGWPDRVKRAAAWVFEHHDLEGRVEELDALLRTLR